MFLHTVAAHYPKHPNAITKKVHYRLFHNFQEFIPHRQIASNYTKLIDAYPVTPYLDSRERLVQWVNFIHNQINALTGKPEVTLQQHRDNMRELYLSKKHRWNRYVRNNFLVVSFMFLVMISAAVYVSFSQSPH